MGLETILHSSVSRANHHIQFCIQTLRTAIWRACLLVCPVWFRCYVYFEFSFV